jgi:hypothetical protein
MPEHEQFVSRFYRQLAGWCALRRAVAAVTAFAFLWGTVVLILRATQGTPAAPLLWAAVGVPVAATLGVWLALRRLPDRVAVRALLDRDGDCGGLLMAGAERDVGRWGVAVAGLPRVRWHGGRSLGLLAVAAGYVALGFLVPVDHPIIAGEPRLDVGREADRLAEQVRVLKEEKVIDADRAEALKQKLDEVRSHAGGKEPAKTLEALDHLDDVVRQAARQAAESAARKASQLGQVQAGAEALQEAAPALDAKAMADLMAELSALAKKAAEGDALNDELGGDLAEAIKSGKLSPELLSKLAAAAKAGKGSAQKTARKLYESRLIDGDQLKACEGDGKCDGKGLAEFLKKNGGKTGLCEALGELAGRGGVNEGPGAAAIQFGERSSEEGAKFREEALPPADLAALKESQAAGVSTAVPQRDTKAGAPQTGALAGATAGGGSANAAGVLPQHRAAVGRYFDRPEKK